MRNWFVRKVIMIENMSIVFGYVMVMPKQENRTENHDTPNSPQSLSRPQSPNDHHAPSDNPDDSNDAQNPSQPTADTGQASINRFDHQIRTERPAKQGRGSL